MSEHVNLIGFPEPEVAELRVQLGRLMPNTLVESMPEHGDALRMDGAECPIQTGALIFIRDSVTSPALVRRLFDADPQANIVILTQIGRAHV